ncbi:GNAT family N-acetyltransferase [Acidicapsa acidisoli]|uniref:GNAT family N-acetyltransferase n=1 Tax=Acidicapsa acidisoli TaxID=1615681 RepID=UPI0021E0A87F|nr:GNAT family N-acetyltransferase [Acidicapsa acidisoli]
MTKAVSFTPLDNPIWLSLISPHAGFARGLGMARRFDPAIGPLSGMKDQSPEAYGALAELFQPDEFAVLFLDSAPELPPGWRMHLHLLLDQMVCEGRPKVPESPFFIEKLSADDALEMLELATLTEPGPFRQRTWELGGFQGIREDGRLAAMAGRRLALPGFVEVSAVCTHPDFRGRGYAAALVASVAGAIYDEGDMPILHVLPTNTGAIRVYESVGFTRRRTFDLAVVLPPAKED